MGGGFKFGFVYEITRGLHVLVGTPNMGKDRAFEQDDRAFRLHGRETKIDRYVGRGVI